MYNENESDSTDETILYDSDENTNSDSNTIHYIEEYQIYDEDIEFIQDDATQMAFDDISFVSDNQFIGYEKIRIGTYKYIRRSMQFLYIMDIPVESFLKYNTYLISRYFYWHSSFYVAENPPVDLIQIYEVAEPDSPFPVIYCIIKTFWIKIIQKVWKKVFRERQRILEGRKSLISIKYREMNGYFPEEYRFMPKFSLQLK